MLSKALPLLSKSRAFLPLAQRSFAGDLKYETFDYQDPFYLDDLLTEEEKAIKEAARQYAQERLMPRVRKAYNDESFDIEIMREMGEQGFLGCTHNEYGLPGVSSVAYGI